MKNKKIIKSLVVIFVVISLALFCNVSKAEIENETITNETVSSGESLKNKNNESEKVSDTTSEDVSDTTSEENVIIFEDVVGIANQLLKNNLKDSGNYSGVSKYPNAGLEENIFVPIIKVLIGLLVISLIFMIIKVKKNKKD